MIARVWHSLFFFFLFILPWFVIPAVPTVQNGIAKVLFAYLCIGALTLLGFFLLLKDKGRITLIWHNATTALALFILVIGASSLFSISPRLSFFGTAYQAESLVVLSLFFLVFFFASHFVRNAQHVIFLYGTLVFGAFTFFLLEFIRIQHLDVTSVFTHGTFVGPVPEAVILILAGALIATFFAATQYVSTRSRVGYAILSVLFISGLAISYLQFNAEYTQYVQNTPAGATLSHQATLDVGIKTIAESQRTALLGTGPNTFLYQWIHHKPESVYQSSFWSFNPEKGSSFFTTLFATSGLLGVFALIIFLSVFLYGNAYWLIKRFSGLHALIFGSAVYFLFTFLFIESGVLIGLLAFLFSGVAIGFVVRPESTRTLSFEPHTIQRGYAYTLLIVLSAGYLWGGWFLFRDAHALQSFYTFQRSVQEETVKLTDEAFTKLQQLRLNDTYKRHFSEALRSLALLDTRNARTYLDASIRLGNEAVAINPHDYRNWRGLGQTSVLSSRITSGDISQAQWAYGEAISRAPSEPALLFEGAQVHILAGDAGQARDLLERALNLKPDYKEARELLESI